MFCCLQEEGFLGRVREEKGEEWGGPDATTGKVEDQGGGRTGRRVQSTLCFGRIRRIACADLSEEFPHLSEVQLCVNRPALTHSFSETFSSISQRCVASLRISMTSPFQLFGSGGLSWV